MAMEARLERRIQGLRNSRAAQSQLLNAQAEGLSAQLATARRELTQLEAEIATRQGQVRIAEETLQRMRRLQGEKYVSELQVKQQEAAQKIVALGLSVRQAELLCKNMSKEPVPQKKEVFAVDYVAECEKSLSKHLGRGVKIVNGKRKGRFELEFYGQEDLQNLLDALMKIQK